MDKKHTQDKSGKTTLLQDNRVVSISSYKENISSKAKQEALSRVIYNAKKLDW